MFYRYTSEKYTNIVRINVSIIYHSWYTKQKNQLNIKRPGHMMSEIPGPALGRVGKGGGVKPINGIQTLSS